MILFLIQLEIFFWRLGTSEVCYLSLSSMNKNKCELTVLDQFLCYQNWLIIDHQSIFHKKYYSKLKFKTPVHGTKKCIEFPPHTSNSALGLRITCPFRMAYCIDESRRLTTGICRITIFLCTSLELATRSVSIEQSRSIFVLFSINEVNHQGGRSPSVDLQWRSIFKPHFQPLSSKQGAPDCAAKVESLKILWWLVETSFQSVQKLNAADDHGTTTWPGQVRIDFALQWGVNTRILTL